MAFVRSLLFINAAVCICLYFLKKHRLLKGLLQTPQNVIFYDYFLFFRCRNYNSEVLNLLFTDERRSEDTAFCRFELYFYPINCMVRKCNYYLTHR